MAYPFIVIWPDPPADKGEEFWRAITEEQLAEQLESVYVDAMRRIVNGEVDAEL